MKRQTKKPISIIVIIIFLLLLSCATTQQIQMESKERVIDMGSFTVNQPPGEDWATKVDKTKGVVAFIKEEGKGMRVFGEIMTGRTMIRGITLIQVNSYIAPPQKWNLNEEKMADNVRNQEESTMIEEGVKKGQYKLEDVKKDVTTIGGKKLYFMSYKAITGSWLSLKGNPKVVEAVIYFYFPQDFEKKHNFYSFLISTSYIRGNLVKVDLTQIYPVINSFQGINPLASLPGTNGDLLRAVDRGNLNKVKDSLDKGADINAQSSQGTSLFLASFNGQIEIVKFLIEKGADINMRNEKGGQTPLMAAIFGGEEIVKLLIEKGTDLNVKDNAGWSPLIWASATNHAEIAKLLIDKGAHINGKNIQGQTPLMFASKWGYIEIVKLLIDKGAEINMQMDDGWTALMDAIDSDHTKIAKLLIEKGADVNLKSKSRSLETPEGKSMQFGGWTALMAAAFKGHTEIAKLLIDKGADVNAKDEHGQTPLTVAKQWKRLEIIRLLQEAGAKE
jgi:ankyrin repeat protein